MKSFDQVIRKINFHIVKKNPPVINEDWIKKNSPVSYAFITENSIDWDIVTLHIERSYQARWNKTSKRKRYTNLARYENQGELDTLLNLHKNKMYTFVSKLSKDDELACDRISILLVRLAQKGNTLAVTELKSLYILCFINGLKKVNPCGDGEDMKARCLIYLKGVFLGTDTRGRL